MAAAVFVHVFLYVNIFWGVCESSEVSVQWPGISSPCSHSQYRNASCQPPRRRRGVDLLSAPSCSHSGPLRLNRELMMKIKRVSSKERNEDREESTVRWGEQRREQRQPTAEAPASMNKDTRGRWEEMLTFLLQYSKLSWIDHSAGDLQLDSFRFQPLKPGQ